MMKIAHVGNNRKSHLFLFVRYCSFFKVLVLTFDFFS